MASRERPVSRRSYLRRVRNRGLLVLLVCAAALVVGGCGSGSRSNQGGWIDSCVHSDHPVAEFGCGWLAAPGRYVFCHNYPDGIQMQLTCYSPISGWRVNIPADDPPGKHPSAWKVGDDVGRSADARTLAAGETWYDSMPERTAETDCRATKRFFRCDLRAYRVWFKPDGTFALDRRVTDPATYAQHYELVYGDHR